MSNTSRRRAQAARHQNPAFGVHAGETESAAAESAANTPKAGDQARPAPALAPAVAQPSAAPAVPVGELFNLDAVSREARGERFRFQAGDKTWYLRSPEELDWLENSIAVALTGQDDLRPFLQQLLREQYDDFVELRITVGQVRALIARWQAWHGVKLPESWASLRS